MGNHRLGGKLAAMIGFTATAWPLTAILMLLHVAACYGLSRWARRIGRDPRRWFFIALFFSELLAIGLLLFETRRRKPLSDGSTKQAGIGERCRHCGAVLAFGNDGQVGRDGVKTCRRCGMAMDNTRYA